MFDIRDIEAAIIQHAAERADRERYSGMEADPAPLSGEWSDSLTPTILFREVGIVEPEDTLNDVEWVSLLELWENTYFSVHEYGVSALEVIR